MLRTLARSLSLAFAVSLVLGVALPESSAYAQSKPGSSKKPPPPAPKKKKKPDGVGPFKKSEYPLSERNRPLILPNQMGEVGADLSYSRFLDTDNVGLGLGFNYGLADIVELGVGTGLLLAPDVDSNRAVVVQAHWLAWDSKEFDFAPGLVIPFVFADGAPFGATIDLTSRYVVSKTVFLTFGQGAIPVGVSPNGTLSLVGNGRIDFQIGKPSVLFADTSVFSMAIAPDLAITGLWDTLVLGLGAQYSPTKQWDIGGRLGLTNVWELEDSLQVALTVYGRVRF